ncbi:MAG: putative transrane protein [Micavibrio sp.]|nr:putative transrane protein [Micavibrio sp.]
MRDSRQEILHFWFTETQPAQWFQKNPDFDTIISERFGSIVTMARDGLCDAWAGDVSGALALCIVLDQFPRNIHRDSVQAYASDEKALRVAVQAIAKGYDQVLPVMKRHFLYLPFEHSEHLADQERAVALFASIRDEDPMGYEYALRHRDVIQRFGRFPHRNAVLGRENTVEEEKYLSQPGSGF